MYGIDDGGDRLIILHQRRRRRGLQDRHRAAGRARARALARSRSLSRGPAHRVGGRARQPPGAARARERPRPHRDPQQGRRRRARGRHSTPKPTTIELTAPYEHNSRTIRFVFASPSTPRRTYDYDLESRERVLRKEQTDSERPRSRRLCGAAAVRVTADKEEVPITLLHRKDTGARRLGAAVSRRLRRLRLQLRGHVRRQRPVARRSRLRLRHRARPWRHRKRRALAQRRAPREQGQHVHGFHCRCGASHQERLHLARADRGTRRFRRRAADGRGRQHAARPVRRHDRAGAVRGCAQHHARRHAAADRERRSRVGRSDPRRQGVPHHRRLLAL